MTLEVSDLSGAGGGKPTRTVVLHPDLRDTARHRDAQSALAEAVALAHALPGLDLRGAQVVRLPRAQAGRLFGSGKIEELKTWFEAEEIELVLIDGPVTPVQQRNLQRDWGVKILDRTGLILEIFADRARTREGVLQVKLAALSYQRTRLVRAWTHLERQRGGLGFVGGPGETQIEADRRAIDEQVVRLKRQLSKVVKTRELHRAARRRVPYPVVALVGYTNAGKSTLFNRLTGAGVLAKDMLFATLDPTMRALTLPGGLDVILSDTVGFISDLPTQLVAAFRATLEEVLEADLILHVRDIAHPETEAQAGDVETILNDLGVSRDTPWLEVWNKADLLPADAPEHVIAARRDDVCIASALTGEGIDALCARVLDLMDARSQRDSLELDYAHARAQAWLHAQGAVVSETAADTGWRLDLHWSARQRRRFAQAFPDALAPAPENAAD